MTIKIFKRNNDETFKMSQVHFLIVMDVLELKYQYNEIIHYDDPMYSHVDRNFCTEK